MDIVYYLNIVLEGLFKFIFNITRTTNRWTGILLISMLTAPGIILVIRWVSNQERIKWAKEKIKGNLLGLIIFNNDLHLIFKHILRVFLFNFIYLANSLKAVIIIFIPLLLIMSQLKHWYNWDPLQVGEKSTLYLSMDKTIDLSNKPFLLENKDIKIAKGPSYFHDINLVVWEFYPIKKGKGNIFLIIGKDTIPKEIIVSDSTLPISPMKNRRSFSLFSSWEKNLPEDVPIREIEVKYPRKELFIGRFQISWWLLFFLCAIISGFILARIFRVEI